MAFIGNTNTTQAFTPAIDYFSGTGSATAFTLSLPVASVAQVQVTIDNVAQNPSSAYTISGSTITFTSAPLSGTNNIYVYYTRPITQVIAPGQGTVTATSMASSTGTGAGVFQTSPTITTPTISTITSAAATALTLQSAGTTAVTIDTSQNLLVGTTSQILSNTKFNFSSSQGGALGSMGFVNTNSPTIKWQIGPDLYGNFVIFNGSAVGAYITNGGTAWTAYSDERLKTTLVPFENASAKVATLRAGTGRYLKDAEGTSRSFLIAQDVQKVLPEAVDANNPDALGLSYTDVIPLLVAAIKEQQALITSLTARITALESR